MTRVDGSRLPVHRGESLTRPDEVQPAPPAMQHSSHSELPEWAEAWSHWMDDAIPIPGTNLRLGIDAIIGLLFPGVGDAFASIGTVSLLILGFRMRLPRVVLGRMMVNIAIDAIAGSLPTVGDLFDVGWKANRQNLLLTRRFRGEGKATAEFGDYVVVVTAIVLVVAVAMVPVTLLVLLGLWLGRS